ncbi:hypothetical protein K474DRAFT_1051294 [Panus rudis PR-1116 ss-1]|nr:hypothetical protein K474DRAFT_1051294 [Panus rudis PR-1116 ss-1]
MVPVLARTMGEAEEWRREGEVWQMKVSLPHAQRDHEDDPGRSTPIDFTSQTSSNLMSDHTITNIIRARMNEASGNLSGRSGSGSGNGGHDEDNGDGDYIDHLQQPGNTKKRKVPANMAGAPHGPESGSGSGAEDEPTDRAIPTGRTDQEYDAIGLQNSASLSSLGGPGAGSGGGPGGGGIGISGRRGRLSRATLAGLQHKEMLKSRKRQLAAVLGALSHGDTLALDQALSTTYPFAQGGVNHEAAANSVYKVRPSKRRGARLALAYKDFYSQLYSHAQDVSPRKPLPEADFTFVCHSATSDRLIATKEEVAALHARFEAELSRQAARAAEAAKQAAAAHNKSQGGKRSDRSKQSRSSSGRGPGSTTTNSTTGPATVGSDPKATKDLDPNLLPSGRSGKKKKRSALANASNPHHLRNYVPSRLPHTGSVNAAQAQANAQNLVSPLPLRFLSADVPPRRRRNKGSGGNDQNVPPPIPNLTNPLEEWICPFCEYDLFYGDDAAFQRAIRNRKKILKRRRRARERAAAAASGAKSATAKNRASTAAGNTQAPGHEEYEDDVHPGFEEQHEEVVAANARARAKEGDRGPGSGYASATGGIGVGGVGPGGGQYAGGQEAVVG